nr:methyl-accepting chemotaxis protein [uncultured Desulfobulbus sp.]
MNTSMPIPAQAHHGHAWKNNWPPLLTASLDILRTLSGSTEQDFLNIGRQMQEAYMHTSELSQTARDLVEIAGGGRVGELMEQLRQMLMEMANYLEQAQERSLHNSNQIGEVGTVLRQVSPPVEDFRRMAKQLYIFEVLIRIESTYLQDMGGEFLNLATDIRKLSSQIKAKTSAIKGNIDGLLKTVGEHSRFFDEELSQGEDRKSAALDNTEHSLASLENIHQNYLNSGTLIESISSQNTNDISEIVQSLQMEDTYRQQVEHVAEALEAVLPLFTQCEQVDDAFDEEMEQKAILKIGDVCEIQHAQLTFASTVLYESVETILAKITHLQASQREITDNIASGSTTTRRGDSFLGAITSNMTAVTDLLQKYGSTTATIDDMMRNVLSTMGEITTFVHDIELFGSEIIQIALNARIKAVSTGQDGASMSTLSDEVGQLSKDAIRRTDIISQALGKIQNITEAIASDSESKQHVLSDQLMEMQQRMHLLLGDLEEVGSELQSLVGQMQQQGKALTLEFDQLTRSIHVHTRTKQIASGVLDKLEQVFTASRKLYPASEAFKQELHNLADRYTMESERRIHAEIAQKHGVTLKQTASTPVEQEAESSEFGDNVDLF